MRMLWVEINDIVWLMKKIGILIFFSALAIGALAQKTLSGTILSKTDGQPIEMATVRLFAHHGADSPEYHA